MNPLPPKLRDWLTESFNRLFQKKPQYFKYWEWTSYALLIISGVPYLLTQFSITLPEPLATLSNKFISGVGLAMWFMSSLPVKSPPVAQTTEGSAVKITDKEVMPFTSKSEKIAVEEAVPTPPVVTEVPDPPPPSTEKNNP